MNIFTMMKGRNLVNALGIPTWLFLIYKGELFYLIFMFIIMNLALSEFYLLTEKKGATPLRWMGLVSSVFIADYYYVQPLTTSHQMIGAAILIVILFGKGKISSIMGDLAKGIKSFKKGMSDDNSGNDNSNNDSDNSNSENK